MSAFIGRERELDALSVELGDVRADAGRFVWMRGRRRVGKSRLVEEFLRRAGIRHLYFQAPRREPAAALARFGGALMESDLPASDLVSAGASFDSWPAALRFAAQGADAEDPIAIVIDELPYLVERDGGFAADLQMVWDRYLENLPVLLIAVGSDVRMMRTLTEYPAELHGRPTREMIVQPLTPAELASFAGVSSAQAFDRYVVVGGFPQLVDSWPEGTSRRQFLEGALADSGTQFVTNALRILTAEFDRESQAARVLDAIGAGERTNANIGRASGVANESTLSTALKTLVGKGVVTEALPYAAPPGRKNKRYFVADSYLRFWLRFVGPSLDEVDRGRGDLVVERIERDWATYRGIAVEPLIRDSLERLLLEPAYAAAFAGARIVGSYWTRNNAVQVDLVGGADRDPSEVSFIGSIKWREKAAFGRDDANSLAAQRAHVPGASGAKLVGVSRRGFAKGTEALDDRFTPDDLLRVSGRARRGSS
jgi:AAA+ ATPase superfamily predicted ATPase